MTLSNRYRPSKNPRKTCVLFVCSHSAPALIVCLPVTIEKLSLSWNRLTSSSTLGAMKNGLPNRNDGANPMPVSAGMTTGWRSADDSRASR